MNPTTPPPTQSQSALIAQAQAVQAANRYAQVRNERDAALLRRITSTSA